MATVCLLWLTAQPALRGAPLATTLNPALVNGPFVTLSWAAADGATSYRLAAGVAPGTTIFTQNVGNVTSVPVTAPLGTFFVRVYAVDATGESPASNEITVVITSLVAAPSAPTNLQIGLNARTLLIAWTPGAGGGAVANFMITAGTTPGASDMVPPVPLGTVRQLTVPNAPVGLYYVRVFAQNAAGRSADSNEVEVNMPVGGACTPPPASTIGVSAFYNIVTLTWPTFVGVQGYRMDVATSPGGPAIVSQPFAANQSSATFMNAPLGTFYAKMTSQASCGATTEGSETTIVVDNQPPAGPRAPDPAPGQLLGIPSYGRSVADEVARIYDADLQNSCREHGGNNQFMFKLVRELRKRDTRWGLNYKRGNFGDMSQDVVTYNGSAVADVSATKIHVIDTISNHCGTGRYSIAWIDQTGPTRDAGARGECFNRDCSLWALLPYVQAGYPASPVSSDQR